MRLLRKIWVWLKKWFWEKPTAPPPRLKATDVMDQYICIKYHDQWINLRKSEIQMWNALSRRDRRAMAYRSSILEKKGKIKFVEINGKMTCIRNKNYGDKKGTE